MDEPTTPPPSGARSRRVTAPAAAGSLIRFSTDPSDYLPAVYSRWQGIEFMNYSPLVYAYGQTNIAVTGAGVLDGRADSTHWWIRSAR